MNTTEIKWKKFEDIVAKIQRDLAPDAIVEQNKRLDGKNSECLREIDILIRKNIGQYEILVAMECKDYNKPVNVTQIEAFTKKIQDVGAHQGVMVSAKGFTKAALNLGKKEKIHLYKMIDCGNHDWKSVVKVKMVFILYILSSFQLIFKSIGSGRFMMPASNEHESIIYDQNHVPLGSVKQILASRWSNVVQGAGHHKNVAFVGQPTKIKCKDEFFDVDLMADIEVRKEMYLQFIELEKVSGFLDESKKELITKSFCTTPLSIEEIRKNGQYIKTEEELNNIKRALTTEAYISPIF